VGRGTVANVLKRDGVEPMPPRSKRTTWATFLKAHWKVLAASDFFSVEVWTARGLVIFVGQASLRRAICEYMAHYHEERNHQGLNNTLIRSDPRNATNDALIHRRQRLGGILNNYYRTAA